MKCSVSQFFSIELLTLLVIDRKNQVDILKTRVLVNDDRDFVTGQRVFKYRFDRHISLATFNSLIFHLAIVSTGYAMQGVADRIKRQAKGKVVLADISALEVVFPNELLVIAVEFPFSV